MFKTNSKLIKLVFILFILVFVIYRIEKLYELPENDDNKKEETKIFCLILTKANNTQTKAKLVYETWAKLCDDFRFVLKFPSNVTSNTNLLPFTGLIDNQIKTDYIEMSHFLEPANLPEDTYEHIPEKVSRAFAHIYEHHFKYDWYLKTDDDTFIIMMNLRKFLRDKDQNKPVTYGYNYVKYVRDGYHSGGAGYLLSKEALRRVGRKLNEDIMFCVRSNMEDIDMALCLRDLGVEIGQSVDEFGRERFHPLTLRDHFYGFYPAWMHKYSEHKPKKGVECCSDTSISFHYMRPHEMRRFNALLKEEIMTMNQSSDSQPTYVSFNNILRRFLKINNNKNKKL